jgi:hypothetical protein
MIVYPMETLLGFLLAFNLLPALTVFLLTHSPKHYRRKVTGRL